MYYSYKNQYPVKNPPERIRLSNGETRTDPFTYSEMLDSGWDYVMDPPDHDARYKILAWNPDLNNRTGVGLNNWELRDIPVEEKLHEATEKQQQLLESLIWRFERYDRELRLDVIPTESLELLVEIETALMTIHEQETYPYVIEWPVMFPSPLLLAEKQNG
jgi:hypothetical protein